MDTEILIILHSVQQKIKEGLTNGLTSLVSIGVRAFEIDISYSSNEGLIVGHPNYKSDVRYGDTVAELFEWQKKHDAQVFLDLKYPLTWDINESTLINIFSKADKKKCTIISYENNFFDILYHNCQLPCGLISNNIPTFQDRHDVWVVPKIFYLHVPKELRNAVILSGIEERGEVQSMAKLGYCKFMTDSTELAEIGTVDD